MANLRNYFVSIKFLSDYLRVKTNNSFGEALGRGIQTLAHRAETGERFIETDGNGAETGGNRVTIHFCTVTIDFCLVTVYFCKVTIELLRGYYPFLHGAD